MTDTKALAVAYYTALGQKDIDAVKKCLHPNVEFADPQEKVLGREAVLKAAKGFTGIFKALVIRKTFGSEDQAVVIYDVDIPAFEKNLRAASLLSFKEGLISKIELIYDTGCLKRGVSV
jgi:hypothetical protein